MNGRLRLFSLLVCASASWLAYGSETIAQYRILGLTLCLVPLVLFSVIWWLFKEFRGYNSISLILYIVSVVCIVPLGITYVGMGVFVPNFLALYDSRPISVWPNIILFVVNTSIYLKTR